MSPDSLDDKDLGDYKKIKEMTSAEFFCQSNEAIDPIGEWCFEQISSYRIDKRKKRDTWRFYTKRISAHSKTLAYKGAFGFYANAWLLYARYAPTILYSRW